MPEVCQSKPSTLFTQESQFKPFLFPSDLCTKRCFNLLTYVPPSVLFHVTLRNVPSLSEWPLGKGRGSMSWLEEKLVAGRVWGDRVGAGEQDLNFPVEGEQRWQCQDWFGRPECRHGRREAFSVEFKWGRNVWFSHLNINFVFFPSAHRDLECCICNLL